MNNHPKKTNNDNLNTYSLYLSELSKLSNQTLINLLNKEVDNYEINALRFLYIAALKRIILSRPIDTSSVGELKRLNLNYVYFLKGNKLVCIDELSIDDVNKWVLKYVRINALAKIIDFKSVITYDKHKIQYWHPLKNRIETISSNLLVQKVLAGPKHKSEYIQLPSVNLSEVCDYSIFRHIMKKHSTNYLLYRLLNQASSAMNNRRMNFLRALNDEIIARKLDLSLLGNPTVLSHFSKYFIRDNKLCLTEHLKEKEIENWIIANHVETNSNSTYEKIKVLGYNCQKIEYEIGQNKRHVESKTNFIIGYVIQNNLNNLTNHDRI